MKVINRAWNAWMEFDSAAKNARSWSKDKTRVPHQIHEQDVSQNHGNRLRAMQIRISSCWNKEVKIIGYGIVAIDRSGQNLMGWKLRERASGNQLQQCAEGVKLALIKAAEQGWRLFSIEIPDTNLLQQILGGRIVVDLLLATLVNDIRELSTMYYKCSFCLGKSNRNDLSSLFSAQALSICSDVEWVNPNLLC